MKKTGQVDRLMEPKIDPYEEFELPIYGFKGSPEQIEQQWIEKVYKGRGDTLPQLTFRAVLTGATLGGILSLTNLYIGLKAGWGFGVAITACILSYAIWTIVYRVGLSSTPISILENNCMQSTASAAGYSTGSTLVSAFAAYVILNQKPLPYELTLVWVFLIALLGVTMAIPMKRQMINIEQLRFPSGIAAAQTLKALHSHGLKGLKAAKALAIAAGLAAIDKFWAEGLPLINKNLEKFTSSYLIERIQQIILDPRLYSTLHARTVVFHWDFIFVAAGALTGIRICTTLVISATICWAIYLPWLQSKGLVSASAGFAEAVQWTLWAGTSCMVSSGILSFILQYKLLGKAIGELTYIFKPRSIKSLSNIDQIETPFSWFLIGQLVGLIGICWLAYVSFQMPWWQSIIAVIFTFFLALVACRVTGETDTTPIGAMGKVMQLIFGLLSPGNITINLMSANITSGAAASAADLLTDLKSGYLLGANPRKQFIAQFCGIFIGTIVTTSAFMIITKNPNSIGSDQFPAPAAQTWAAVAQALSIGLDALHPIKQTSIIWGGIVGVLLTILPRIFPRYAPYIPSGAAAGLAWVFHWYYSFLFFIGAIIAFYIERKKHLWTKDYLFPVASGIIAGGSLMGVALVFWSILR